MSGLVSKVVATLPALWLSAHAVSLSGTYRFVADAAGVESLDHGSALRGSNEAMWVRNPYCDAGTTQMNQPVGSLESGNRRSEVVDKLDQRTNNHGGLAHSSISLIGETPIPEIEAEEYTPILPSGIHFTKPGSPFAVTQDGSSLYITDVRNGQRVNEFSVKETVLPSTVQFSPDNTHLIFSSGNIEGGLQTYLIRIGDHTLTLVPRIGLCSELKWIDNGSFLFTDVNNHSFQFDIDDLISFPSNQHNQSIHPGSARIVSKQRLKGGMIWKSMAGKNWMKMQIRNQDSFAFLDTETGETITLYDVKRAWMIDDSYALAISDDGIYLCEREGQSFAKKESIHWKNKPHLNHISWFTRNENGSMKKYLFWVDENQPSLHGFDVQSRSMVDFHEIRLDNDNHMIRDGVPFILSQDPSHHVYLTDVRNGQRTKKIPFGKHISGIAMKLSDDERHILIRANNKDRYLLSIEEMNFNLIPDTSARVKINWLSNELFTVSLSHNEGNKHSVRLIHVNDVRDEMVIPCQSSCNPSDFEVGSIVPISDLLSTQVRSMDSPNSHLIIGTYILRLEIGDINLADLPKSRVRASISEIVDPTAFPAHRIHILNKISVDRVIKIDRTIAGSDWISLMNPHSFDFFNTQTGIHLEVKGFQKAWLIDDQNALGWQNYQLFKLKRKGGSFVARKGGHSFGRNVEWFINEEGKSAHKRRVFVFTIEFRKHKVNLIDVGRWEKIETITLPHGYHFSEAGSPFVITKDCNTLYITDLRNLDRIAQLYLGDSTSKLSVHFSPDIKYVLLQVNSDLQTEAYILGVEEKSIQPLWEATPKSIIRWLSDHVLIVSAKSESSENPKPRKLIDVSSSPVKCTVIANRSDESAPQWEVGSSHNPCDLLEYAHPRISAPANHLLVGNTLYSLKWERVQD